jgi:hypothetical protein
MRANRFAVSANELAQDWLSAMLAEVCGTRWHAGASSQKALRNGAFDVPKIK